MGGCAGAGGGLNGRPQKLPDVCYSWWCLSSLALLDRLHWIDGAALTAFILGCQDPHAGGISDRPDDAADVYHTFFGVAGLSLLGYPGLARIDPTYALPEAALARTFSASTLPGCCTPMVTPTIMSCGETFSDRSMASEE